MHPLYFKIYKSFDFCNEKKVHSIGIFRLLAERSDKPRYRAEVEKSLSSGLHSSAKKKHKSFLGYSKNIKYAGKSFAILLAA